VNFNAAPPNDFPATQHIGQQTTTMNPVLYDRGRGQGLIAQVSPKKDAWLAKLDTTKPYLADCKLHIQKIVQPHASGHQVSARKRQIKRAGVFRAEAFNLLGFDQRNILSQVSTLAKISIAKDSHSALDGDVFTLYLSRAALRANEDMFDDHRGLLPHNYLIPTWEISDTRNSPPSAFRKIARVHSCRVGKSSSTCNN
jgi:hypothetical protein